MKHKPLLRLLALICIVISSLGLMALHLDKKKEISAEQSQENSTGTDSKNTQGEVMLWESLSRHILSFK